MNSRHISTLGLLIICCRYACDLRVVCLLRERSHGNSVTQLYNEVRVQHSEAWLRRTVQYLTACEPFTTSSLLVPPTFAQPPPQPLLPKPQWFMSVYVRDVMHRLDDVRAKITSVFGTILKMDSTKKVHTLISLGQSR